MACEEKKNYKKILLHTVTVVVWKQIQFMELLTGLEVNVS